MKNLRRRRRAAFACIALLISIFSLTKSPQTGDNPSNRPGVTGEYASKKEATFVVTLQGVEGAKARNTKRLDRFLAHFKDLCGGNVIDIAPVRGKLDKRRGFGLTMAFVAALERAVSINAEFVYIFEDDVRLTNPLFCNATFRETIWKEVPSDAFAIILAAHDIHGSELIETPNFVYVELQKHYGSYAWAIRKENIHILLDYWKNILYEQRTPSLSPDLDLSSRMFQAKYSLLMQSPALFTHPSGFSNTWNRERGAVDDIEKTSLILSHCSFKDVPAIKRYLLWSDIFHVVVAVHAEDVKLQREDQLSNIDSQMLRVVESSDINALVHNISSSVIFHSRCDARITKEDLMRIWKMHLYYPFDVIRFHDGRLSHDCVGRQRVDVSSIGNVRAGELIIAQKRFYRSLHTTEITSNEVRALIGASLLMKFHSAKLTKEYSMNACRNNVFR